MKNNCLLLSMLCLVFSCDKGEEAPDDVPVIEFIEVSPQAVAEYTDSLTFVIGYEDGDGDLGSNDPDVKNLFLTDSRNKVTYKYRVKQLAPTGAAIAIKGTLSVVLDNIALINGTATETTTFDIYVTDNAGNQSNIITSTLVTVNP